MKRIMGLWDIVFMNLAAILGLRWLPIAAGYGASSITLWVLAAILFFIPLSVISTELATTWPEEGGLYMWVKHAYGDKLAFLVSWFYWINSFFYLPSVFTFFAVTLAFIFYPPLAKNKLFVCSVILGTLWIVTLLNFRSLKIVKRISNLAGTCGVILPGILLIALGALAVFFLKRPIPTDYSWSSLIPNFGAGSNIVFLSTLMFSMAGIEITPILAGETENPQKTFPRATLISGILIVGIYIIGTSAITMMISPAEIGAASGIMDALHLIGKDLGFAFIAPVVALLILLGNVGAMSVWSVTPVKMFLESTKEGILPKAFTKLNKNDMPSRAMLVQSSIVTVVILATSFLPSVNTFYETLVLMATVTYFIPYLMMFTSFLKLRKIFPHKKRPYRVPGGKVTAFAMTAFGLCSVLLAIILPFIVAPNDLQAAHDILMYRIEMAAGPILFFVLGYIIYTMYEYRKK